MPAHRPAVVEGICDPCEGWRSVLEPGGSSVSVRTRSAAARLGNWNRQERVLSGRLDDFVVLSRVLPADEILAFF